MSKLMCECGHIIVDQTDNLPYKANYTRDQDVDDYYKRFDEVESFLEALKKGDRVAWIKSHFGENYPTNLSDSSIVHDIILHYDCKIYQCENCGRLLVQKWDVNSYYSFYPENENSKGLFIKNIENTEGGNTL
jgi:hypothetical protein